MLAAGFDAPGSEILTPGAEVEVSGGLVEDAPRPLNRLLVAEAEPGPVLVAGNRVDMGALDVADGWVALVLAVGNENVGVGAAVDALPSSVLG